MTSRRISGPTFRRRVTVSMTVLAVTVLTAASAFTYLRVRQALVAHLDGALLSIALTEVASALDGPDGHLHVHEELPVLSAPGGLGYEKFAEIRDEHRRSRAQSTNLRGGPRLETDPALEAQALRGQVSFGDMRRGDEVYRGIYYPLRGDGGASLVALVALPSGPLQRSLDSLLGALGLTLLLGTGAAAFGASRLARRLTRPLEEVAAAAAEIGGANLTARIPNVAQEVELRQVTRVLNDMLQRLETAFASQRSFVADASHELRSPLSNLRGTLEVALRRPRQPAEYQDAMGVALIEVERLTRLVDDLLMLSRGDAQQLALDLRPCDVSDIARAAVAALAARGDEKGVHLRLDAQPAAIAGDANRLRQAVDNLLDNAVRHAPAGSEVVVTTGRADGHVVLSVRDAGQGLTAEEQAHIFDRFYRADASRARDSGGLGLGLPIAQAIVAAHQGRISVRSSPGNGCLFSVELPAA